jgi:hypothetical protein
MPASRGCCGPPPTVTVVATDGAPMAEGVPPVVPSGGGGGGTHRRALSAMRLSELKKQARSSGVGDEALEEADDANDIKAAVIELIVAAGGADREALRAELAPLKLSALKKRARTAGVDEEMLEAADDADDIRAAVIELLVAAEAEDGGDREALRAELATLKLTALKKRAREVGVDAAALDAADDAADIKAAVIELILDLAAAGRVAPAAAARKALEDELAQMKLSALKQMARSASVGEDDLEGCDDADNIHAAVIALILAAECGAAGPPSRAVFLTHAVYNVCAHRARIGMAGDHHRRVSLDANAR